MNKNIILEDLNEEQLDAVTTTEGFIRVIAGAGSGKTRALTRRFAYLVTHLDIHSSRILSVTFTNKAANEMKSRVSNLLGGNVAIPFIQTFHGFCNRVLRDEIDKMGFPLKFKVIDTEDQIALLKPIYEELNISNKDIAYKKALHDIVGKGCKNGLRSILSNYEELLDNYSIKQIDDLIDVSPSIETKIALGYLREQKREYCLDYDDLLNFVLYLFKKNPYVRERWQDSFDYVQVDEFQDVSLREFELVAILTQKSKNLFVVGDGDQTIYSWRGANVNCIIEFGEILSKLAGELQEVKTLYMITNYRSTPEILDVSNSLIKNNINRLDKNLITPNKSGKKTLYYHAKNIYQQADWVVKRIMSLNRPYKDFAILYRNNTSSRVLEEKLVANKIPYEILSGISFYQRKEIKDILAILSLVAFEDNISFKRVLSNFSLKIGAKKIEHLMQVANKYECNLYTALKINMDDKQFKSTKATFLVNVIEDLKESLEERNLEYIVSRVVEYFELETMYKGVEEERWENILELKSSVRHFERAAREKVDLADYLSTLSLYTDNDKEVDGDKVQLMTIHGSKGLEFPVVFIVDMNEGIVPSSRTKTLDALEEERRIVYVAMTRAEEILFLSDAEGENYDKSPRLPSRFIFNIERDLYNSEGVIDEYLLKMTKNLIGDTNYSVNEEKLVDSVATISNELKVGQRVYHEIFSTGTIIKEDDSQNIFIILFDKYGIKGIQKDSKKLSISI